MGRMKEFLTCNKCETTLLDQYEKDELVIKETALKGYLEYTCPVCHTKNIKKNRRLDV